MVRNLRCTVTIDSVLANCRHRTLSYPLSTPCFVKLPPSGETCKYATAPITKKLGEILYLLIWSFLLRPSWLLRCRFRNFGRDLWIILYVTHFVILPNSTIGAFHLILYFLTRIIFNEECEPWGSCFLYQFPTSRRAQSVSLISPFFYSL
jgi:hypothetical protein